MGTQEESTKNRISTPNKDWIPTLENVRIRLKFVSFYLYRAKVMVFGKPKTITIKHFNNLMFN